MSTDEINTAIRKNTETCHKADDKTNFFNRSRCYYFSLQSHQPPDGNRWSLTNGIKNFYFDGTDSFGMLKHYSGN
jgi:hypothetical protein